MKLTQQARECTRINKETDIESRAFNKSLRKMDYSQVQVLVRSENEREHLLTPDFSC